MRGPAAPAARRFSQATAAPLLRLAAALAAGCASGDAPWPERVVGVEQMPAGELHARVPAPWAVDRSRTSTVVLHVHVDAAGLPVRARIERSSGNPRIDEAALGAVRKARFAPLQVDGVAQPVTLVLPMQFPFQERPR